MSQRHDHLVLPGRSTRTAVTSAARRGLSSTHQRWLPVLAHTHEHVYISMLNQETRLKHCPATVLSDQHIIPGEFYARFLPLSQINLWPYTTRLDFLCCFGRRPKPKDSRNRIRIGPFDSFHNLVKFIYTRCLLQA